jgi:hypothetical protein
MDKPPRTLTFYGASDDLFECDDSAGRDTEEIGAYNTVPAYEVKTPDGAGLQVIGVYASGDMKNAVWASGIAPLDEDVPIPAWPVRFALGRRGYSAALIIEVPDDAKCSPQRKAKDDD